MAKGELNDVPQKYHVEQEPLTPYNKAKLAWDNRIGSARVQAFNWRVAFFCAMGVCLVLSVGMIYLASRTAIVPYIVKISGDGTATATAATDQKYTPQTKEIESFLAQYILKCRSVSSDHVLYKQNWYSAYSCMTQGAAGKLNTLMQKDPQTKYLDENDTVQVAIVSVLQTSSTTYQIRWREDVFDPSGGKKESYTMTGLFTISMQSPKDEKELLNNPLSIYISDISWNRDL